MELKEYLQAQINKIIGDDIELLENFETWKKDPIYDFENEEISNLQDYIWELEQLIEKSEKLDAIEKTISFIKNCK